VLLKPTPLTQKKEDFRSSLIDVKKRFSIVATKDFEARQQQAL